jgi:hypothetical protein
MSKITMSATKVRCRRILDSDILAVAELLARGFPARPHKFWLRVLARMSERSPPDNHAKYGYLLESEGTPRGVLLLIYSVVPTTSGPATRCNLSSWYVEPKYRCYASALIMSALKHKDVTYLNVTAAPHTRSTVEAQGFRAYSKGIFVSLPALNFRSGKRQGSILPAEAQPHAAYEPFERDLLLDHQSHGCISFWYETAERAYPFVFRPRAVKGVLPCAQLVYCRSLDDFVSFAPPLGRYLAKLGRALVVVDSNGPLPGIPGIFLRGRMPKFFKGLHAPRLGDLAHTDTALFGV